MTPNNTLSIPNALKRERPEDYYQNTATIEWPLGPSGKPFAIRGSFWPAAVYKDGGHTATAKEFVRFLVAEGWLGHYLDFSGERMLPAMPKLLDAPFWLDPSDPHRMASVMQVASRPMQYDYATVSGDRRYDLIWQERVWEKAIHRIVTEGISPEQAVDEAIARIKQILSEVSIMSWLTQVCFAVALRRWRRSALRPPTSWCGGRRASTPRRTRRSRRLSPPSSRTAASTSSSLSIRSAELPGQDRGGARGGPTARFRVRHDSCPSTSRSGPSTIGSWTLRTLSAISRTCSIRTHSPGGCCSIKRSGRGRCMRCRWAARPTTSTSGRASGAGGVHPRRHSEGVGRLLVVLVRPGPAGRAPGHGARRHLGRRPQHVGRSAPTRRISSSNSCPPTMRTT